jgi:glycosyltransferase involved in cell wall biosynthesis
LAAATPPLAVIIPTLGRPQALGPLVDVFAQTTPVPHRMLFVIDPDDGPTWEAVENLDRPEVNALEHGGTYPQKVNAGIRATTEPILLIGADDIRPHPGWFEKASRHLSAQIGFVSLNDLGNEEVMAGNYAIHPLVARWYVAGGELFHEGYEHIGCDVDASRIARSRGAFAYAPDAVMEHLHPNYGKAPVDATYERGGLNEAKNVADQALLAERWG